MAEEQGKLCRDDTIEGLFFYPNKFLNIDLTMAADRNSINSNLAHQLEANKEEDGSIGS
jgi:hypothetical protein